MKTQNVPYIPLNNGAKIPQLGFGTWKLQGQDARNAVGWALEAGYRHLDTATIYGNEQEIGRAIRESGVAREDLFITTKLWNGDHDDPDAALRTSLEKLQLDYVDLYLIHWPVSRRNQSWKKLEQMQENDLALSVGVSNFTVRHLEELLGHAKVVPQVNQVEMSPFLYQKELMEFCREQGVAVEAYSPLTRGKFLDEPPLVELARKYGKTSAQLLLRWSLQHGMVVIPKSGNLERIQENMDIFDFEISPEDMEFLNGMNRGYRSTSDPHKME